MSLSEDKSVVSESGVLKRLQCILLTGAASKKWKKQAARSRDRFFRLRELTTTEEDYQKDLNSIKIKIKQPLLTCGAINQIEANSIFANIDSMIQLSAQLSQEFAVKLAGWDRKTTMIGQTMIRFSKFLLVYSDFFKNFNQNQRRLKEMLIKNQYVKKIQKQLSSGSRIVTFQDLMSKPFQRPLKYHLILKDYASKTNASHPDAPFLQEAINCYRKVNEQNNQALENKEKDHILIGLDKRFGNIIAGEARYYVGQYEAIYIDLLVTVYLFSDLVILSQKEKGQKQAQYMRIYLQKYSHIQIPPDGNFFINRLYLYGKRVCVHLSFLDKTLRDEVYNHLVGLISAITKNQDNREDIISQRSTRNSVVQRRKSFTQLQPQFKRPMIVSILGNEKRVYGPDRAILYFVVQFHPTPAKWNGPAPHQISLVSLQTILKLQTMCKKLYPELRCFSIFHCPKGLTQYQSQKNENKRLQFQSIFLHLQLNTIFRHEQILKRIDIFSYYLKMSQPLWIYLKKQTQCCCYGCVNKKHYQNITDYFTQKSKRMMNKNQSSQMAQSQRRFQFCDLRTIKIQEMIGNLPESEFVKGQQRIIWIKSKLGWVNHTLTHQRGNAIKKSFYVNLCNVNNNCRIELEFSSITRIKTILDFLGQKLNVSLEDYALTAYINDNMYIFSDDQILGDVLPVVKEEKGIFSGFFDSKDYPIDLYLRKLWVLQYPIQRNYDERKLILQIDQVIYRLRYQELRLGDIQTQCVYALYYAHQHFIELDTLTFNKLKMKSEFFNKILPSRLRNNSFLQKIFTAIEEIKKNSSIVKTIQLALKIIEIVNDRPGWSCTFIAGQWKENQNYSNGIPIKIGCDSRGIKIRELGKSMLLFNFQFGSSHLNCEINGLQLVIREQKDYVFEGNDLWKVKQQFQFYKLYYSSFLKKK